MTATTVGVVSLLLVLTTHDVWWAMGLAVAAAAIAVLRAVAARATLGRLLGSHLLLRSVLVLVVAVAYGQRRHDKVEIWTAAALLLITTVGEPLLAKLYESSNFVAAHVPGLDDRWKPSVLPVWMPWLSPLALGAGWALAALAAPAWVWLIIVIASSLVSLTLLVQGVQSIRRSAKVRAGLVDAVGRYAPEFVIYAGRKEDASYQVTMWLPYLERTGRRFVILTRAGQPGASLAEQTTAPVVCCRTVAEIESLLVPSLTTVFYPNAASANGQMVRYSHLTHVHLGHGDSDKATSYNPLHAMYDKIFCAGPAAVERYANHGILIPPDRFAIVGRPQAEFVERPPEPRAPVAEPVVLYAPTWRGHVDETLLYSLPRGEALVRALLDRGATVIFRPHPFNLDIASDAMTVDRINQVLRADASRTGRRHVWGKEALRDKSIIDCFNASDAMISDVSSVVSDYLYSGKPLAMYSVADSDAEFVEDFPVGRAAYVISRDLSNLTAVLDDLLGADPRRRTREQVRAYYLGDLPHDGYSDVFVAAADRVIGAAGGRVRDTSVEDTDDNGGKKTSGEWWDGRDPEQEEERQGAGEPETTDTLDVAVQQGLETDSPAESRTGGGSQRGGLSRGEIIAAAPVGASVVAVVAALADVTPWLSTALITLCLTFVTWSGNRRLTSVRSNMSALGAWVPVRVLLAVAVVALAGRRSDETRTMLWLTLGSLLVGLCLEMWVRESRKVRRLRVRHLKTLQYRNPRPPLEGWMFAAGLAPMWLALVLAVAAAPLWLATAVAVEALALGGYLAYREQRLIAAHERGMAELKGAIEEHRPEFVVYFASKTGASYQVGMWMPFFERLGRRFIVVTRYDDSLLPLAELTSSPVVLCRTLASLEDTIVPTLRAAFYVNNGLTNTHYVEHRNMTHIWLNHGDSEKPACFNPVHAIYDKIFAAGQAGVDRYARHGVDIPREKFEIVGRPQVSGIDVARQPIQQVAAPTVLYAPTWVGPYADSRLYSLPQGLEIVRGLLARGCTVIFRAHPLNYGYAEAKGYMEGIWDLLAADQQSTGRRHRWGWDAEKGMDVKECFNASDAMIADVSAVVTDYLQSQKPFSMVAAESNSDALIAKAPVAVAAYRLQGDLSNLDEVLDDLLVRDPLVEQRRVTKDYYLGGAGDDDPAQPFVRAARAHLDASTTDRDALANG